MKKLLALLLVAVMALSLATAFATEGVPSKTISDVAEVTDVETTGETPADDFAVATVASDDVEDIIAEIAAAVADEKAPIEYFPEDVQSDIAAKLPAGVDAKALELNEVASIDVTGYKAEYGDVYATFELDTPYDASQEVYPVIGIINGEDVEWIAVEGEVTAEGNVKVLLTADVIAKIEAADATALAILSTPLAK